MYGTEILFIYLGIFMHYSWRSVLSQVAWSSALQKDQNYSCHITDHILTTFMMLPWAG